MRVAGAEWLPSMMRCEGSGRVAHICAGKPDDRTSVGEETRWHTYRSRRSERETVEAGVVAWNMMHTLLSGAGGSVCRRNRECAQCTVGIFVRGCWWVLFCFFEPVIHTMIHTHLPDLTPPRVLLTLFLASWDSKIIPKRTGTGPGGTVLHVGRGGGQQRGRS